MKKNLLLLAVLFVNTIFGQTATNFNVNDCSGTNHDLFSELDAGKVVVICWVMPCGACIAPALSAYTQVQNYNSSNPGRVVYYLVDDYGTTSCTSLTNWGSTNGITGVPVFSNSVIQMSDYGTDGMPKTVVLAGTNHDVLFNQNNGLNVTNFTSAISAGLVTGINEKPKNDFKLSVFPNPTTTNKVTIRYVLKETSAVSVDVYDTLGAKVKTLYLEKQLSGLHESEVDLLTLAKGIYFLKLNASGSSQLVKFTISH